MAFRGGDEMGKCRYVKICRDELHHEKCDECTNDDTFDCPTAWRIEDILMDVADPDWKCQDEDEIPFSEPYDGPEYEGGED